MTKFTIHPGASPLDETVLREAVTLYLGGRVGREAVTTPWAVYEVEGLVIRALPAAGAGVEKLFTAAFALMAGFYASGLGVTCEGAEAARLPGGGRLESDRVFGGFVRGFEDQLAPAARSMPLTVERLKEVHAAFYGEGPGYERVFGNAGSWEVLRHPSGLEIAVEAGRGHGVMGYALEALTGEVATDRVALEVRTWGEALASNFLGSAPGLPPIQAFPGEVAILRGGVRRYRVADGSTLARLDQVSFGQGASAVFGYEQFRQFAAEFKAGGWMHARVACLEQMALLARTEEQRALVRELTRPEAVLAEGVAPRQCGIAELKEILGMDGLEVVRELVRGREELYAHSDFGRYPMEIPGVTYGKFTLNDLLDAGFTRALLTRVTEREAPEARPNFWVQVAGRRIWGGNGTRWLYVEGVADRVYG
jgi:hypothetical protein